MSEEVKEKGPNAHSKSMWIKILVLSLIVIAVAGVVFFQEPAAAGHDDQGKPSQPAAQTVRQGKKQSRPADKLQTAPAVRISITAPRNLIWTRLKALIWIRSCHMGCQSSWISARIHAFRARKWRPY